MKKDYKKFPEFEGTKEEKIIQFLKHLNFDMDVFDDFIAGYKRIDPEKYVCFYKFINFNLKTNRVEFCAMYLEDDIYPDNINELLKWDSPELFKIANDLMK